MAKSSKFLWSHFFKSKWAFHLDQWFSTFGSWRNTEAKIRIVVDHVQKPHPHAHKNKQLNL